MKLTAVRGDSTAWDFAVRQPGGGAQTLVGASATFSARARLSDADPLFTRTIGAGITVTDAAGGLLTVRLAAANTVGLTQPTTLYWDLEVVDAASNHLTVADGLLFVRPDVSR